MCLIVVLRIALLFALLLTSAFQTALGATEGVWTYTVTNNQATITAYTGPGGAVVIPSSIGGYAVTGLGGAYPGLFAPAAWPGQNTTVTSITIPTSVTNIKDYAFTGCTRLTNVTIPDSVTNIGQNAFAGCSVITNINIPSSVTVIGSYAFATCGRLASINIPSGITTVENNIASDCSALADITIPNGVTSIGSEAFKGALKVTSITIPNSVTSIGSGAFGACTNLISINIPSGVTRIESATFASCFSLPNITIPNTVTLIDNSAFSSCTKLTRVNCRGNAPSYGSNVFYSSTPTVYYIIGTTGWGPTYAGRPTALYNTLTVYCDPTKGEVTINPNKIYFSEGESVIISATPIAGYLLSAWSGASTESANPVTLIMDADKALTANLIQDGGDSDADQLTNFQEIVTYGTNPNLKDSNADGVEDGQAVSMGYSPTLNFSALIAHPPTGLYTASQMQAMAIGDLVLTKNPNGSFVLNYDIEQSTDLQSWSLYQSFDHTLYDLPPDKAFIRIKAK